MNIPQTQKRMAKIMLTLFWLAVLAGLTLFFGNWEERRYNPNTKPASAMVGSEAIVTLERNAYGHYLSNGFINGQSALFLLDTGATMVAVPEPLARKFGLPKGRAHRINTANGIAKAYQTEIEHLKIGAIELRKVRASITPGMQGEEILLGMSVLKHIDFSQSGKTLTLSQKQ